MIDFRNVTIRQLHEMFRNNEVSVEEVTRDILKVAKENEYNAFIDVCEEDAIRKAKELDSNGIVNLFDGIPCAIKDNMNYTGYLNTCGSKILENYKSVYNATVVNKLLKANMIITGKLNMDEFAMGASNTTSYYGNVLNPLNKKCIPGGSSGGSAAAVASGLIPFSLGSDTGGSVRQPAAYCGIVGFRPTYGMVSRYGVVSLNCSLDQVGIFTNTVEDNALVFDMLQGKDENDTTTVDMKLNASANLEFSPKGKKIAIVSSAFDHVSNAVALNMKSVTEFLRKQGVEVEIVNMKYLHDSSYVYTGLVGCEITSNLSMFDGIRYGYRSEDYEDLDHLYANTRGEGFGLEVKRRMMIGMEMLKNKNHQRYEELHIYRRLIVNEFDELFNKFDYIITPTAPTTAYTFEEYDNMDKIDELYESQFMDATALAGLPGISVPMGFDKEKQMPHGLQFVANRKEDEKVFAIAKYFEDYYEVGEF
ncbi:MAG: amidase family protein [Bacilli bacterium]